MLADWHLEAVSSKCHQNSLDKIKKLTILVKIIILFAFYVFFSIHKNIDTQRFKKILINKWVLERT